MNSKITIDDHTSSTSYEICESAAGIKDGKEMLQKIITETLNHKMEKCDNKIDVKELAERMSGSLYEQICHFSDKHLNRKKQVRYSDEVIRFALLIWLKSKSGYTLLKDNSSVVLPYGRTLQRYSVIIIFFTNS